MDIVSFASLESDDGRRFARAVEDHWRYAQASTVASGSTEVQRILLARTLTST
jgi:alkylation response protein AidB-like acyl-CoA dehydrogenase